MSIILSPISLYELDRLQRDLLVLPFFADERPLFGISSFVDWRLNGRLSRYIETGEITGHAGECLLTNSSGRLGAERLLLFGLGQSHEFDNLAFMRLSEQLLAIVKGLEAQSLALGIPGSDSADDYLLERLAILCRTLSQKYSGAVTLFAQRRHPFKELSAKFELIRKELERTPSKAAVPPALKPLARKGH